MEISVVIPLFNKQQTILNTIQSVLSQSFLPFEILVVNDGSTDDSAVLVQRFNHPMVRLIQQENQGVSSARNLGIEQSQAEWIAFLDADDIWFPSYLENLRNLLNSFPQATVLAGRYLLEDFRGHRNEMVLNKIPFQGEEGILSNYFEVASCSHPPIWSSSVAIMKDALRAIGGFPQGVKSGEDLITWARLAVNNSIAYSLKPNAVFVQAAAHTYHDSPNRIPEEPDYVGNNLQVLYQKFPETPFLDKYIAHWAKMRASIFLRLGMKKKAWKEIKKSLTFDLTNFKVYLYFGLLFLPARSIRKVFQFLAS
jgi:glycosyltransferase involved in cell wall biosynthesis